MSQYLGTVSTVQHKILYSTSSMNSAMCIAGLLSAYAAVKVLGRCHETEYAEYALEHKRGVARWRMQVSVNCCCR